MSPKEYRVNEIFWSLQGEGMRAGTANTFVRFSGCNLACDIEPGPRSPGGFKCDTEFESGRSLLLGHVLEQVRETSHGCKGVILTGGEPGLQVDEELVDALQVAGFFVAIETNGTVPVPDCLDWITVSPKVAEHALVQLTANEVKYVRGEGQAIPKTKVRPRETGPLHRLISPAFLGLDVDRRALAWCVQLVKENPPWRLSIQMHKDWRIR